MPSTLGSDALTSPPHQRARGLWSPWAAPSVRPRPGCSPPPGGGQRLPGRRRPLGTPPLHPPCDLDHQPGQPRRPLHAPLAPVAPAAPTGVPHALGQLAFHPGRVVTPRRGAGRPGRRPRRRRLVMRDDAPPGRRGRGGQARPLQQAPRPLAPGTAPRPARVVGVAGVGRGLLPPGAAHHAPLGLQDTRRGTTPGPRGRRGRGRDGDGPAQARGGPPGPPDRPVPAAPILRDRLDRMALGPCLRGPPPLGIPRRLAVAGQEGARRAPGAVGGQTARAPRPLPRGARRATPGVGGSARTRCAQ